MQRILRLLGPDPDPDALYRALGSDEVASAVSLPWQLISAEAREELLMRTLTAAALYEARRRGHRRVIFAPRSRPDQMASEWVEVDDAAWAALRGSAPADLLAGRFVCLFPRGRGALRSIIERATGKPLPPAHLIWAAAVLFDPDSGQLQRVYLNEELARAPEGMAMAAFQVRADGAVAYASNLPDRALARIGQRLMLPEVIFSLLEIAALERHSQAAVQMPLPGMPDAPSPPPSSMRRRLEAAADALGCDRLAFSLLFDLCWRLLWPRLRAIQPAPPAWTPSALARSAGPFPAPTSLLPLIRCFSPHSALPPPASTTDLSGPEPVKRVAFSWPGTELRLCLEGPIDGQPQALEELAEQLLKICDPLALKVLYACLFLAARRNKPEFFYEPSRFLDILGYRRSPSGHHHTHNRRRVESRMRALSQITFEVQFRSDPLTMRLREPLLSIDENATAEIFSSGRLLARGTRVRIAQALFEDLQARRLFTWIDPRFFSLSAHTDGDAILLYAYYATAWRIDWQRSRGRLKRRLQTILEACGIDIEGLRRAGKLSAKIRHIEAQHDLLMHRGLIANWRILEFGGRSRLDELWEIVAPDTIRNHLAPLSK